MYFASLDASCELAAVQGPYETYAGKLANLHKFDLSQNRAYWLSSAGSPMSKGLLQQDLWNVTPTSGRWDWTALRARIATHGVRNSLLLAPMPTASTAQILGNNESTEPFTANMYNRRVLAGEFTVVNKV